MKNLMIATLLFSLCSLLVACGNDEKMSNKLLGTWSPDCQKNDRSRDIRITEKQIMFYSGAADITSINDLGAGVYDVEYRSLREGSDNVGLSRFTVNGDTLTKVGEGDASGVLRYRCSGA